MCSAQPCGETEEFWQSPARIKSAPVKTLPSGPYFTDTTYSAARVPSFFGGARRAEIICGIHARPRWPLAIEYTFRRELMPNSASVSGDFCDQPFRRMRNLFRESCYTLQRVPAVFLVFHSVVYRSRLCSSSCFSFIKLLCFSRAASCGFFFFLLVANFC